MKKFFKMFVWWNLYIQIKVIKSFKKPFVVLVVGGSEKGILREQIANEASKLGLSYNKSYRHYNTWFGVALNFLDLPSAYSDYKKWVWIYIYSWIKFFKHLVVFPKYLFLEGGIDTKGEADKFISLLSPHIVVFTKLDHFFQDDFDKLNLIQKEILKFVQFLNTKSSNLPSFHDEKTLSDFVKIYIKEKQPYIGAISNKGEGLDFIKEKLKRKILI